MSWDLNSYFPTFNGPEMLRFKEDLGRDVESLRGLAARLSPLNDANGQAWREVLTCHEELTRRMSHLSSYLGCLVASDAGNEAYRREEAQLLRLRAAFAKIRIELLRGFKEPSERLFADFVAKDSLAGAQNYLKRLREEARRAMIAEKEILATDLGIDGIQAWGRLYDAISAKLEFEMIYPDGHRESLPMSRRRSLLDHPDRRVRKAAFDGGNDAWRSVEDTVAAALNAIAGTRLTLNRHRGVNDFLDIALFQAGISRKTLDAMFDALFANLEIPRRVLRLKARTMKTAGVAWYDLGAPLDIPYQKPLFWGDAKALVYSAFTRAYPALGRFFQTAIDRQWIDWEPRAGKRPGAFCTTSMLSQESRVFMTYNDSLGDVLTLAHESGHAFHGYLMRAVRPYARIYPMTLAETASTFGELLLTNGMLQDPSLSDAERAVMLAVEVGHGGIYLLDIPVRFEFERRFYVEREGGEVGASRLKELMVDTQRRLLGDVLEPGGENHYFWASKLHFYITGLTFYNFPYTFGFLLSRGLFAMFKREGSDFLPKYEEFLRLAGSESPEKLVWQTLGQDLEQPAFWAEAMHSLEEPLDRLEALLPSVLRSAPA